MADDLYTRRQTLTGLGAVSVTTVAGCVTAGRGPETTKSGVTSSSNSPTSTDGGTSSTSEYVPLTEHYGNSPVTYEHDQIRLRVSEDSVLPGGTIQFEVTNTSDSKVTFGCNNPWTVQQQMDGQWRDVLWTPANGIPACATTLESGGMTQKEITMSETALEKGTSKLQYELTSGLYRFVLLGTNPFLAVDFHLRKTN